MTRIEWRLARVQSWLLRRNVALWAAELIDRILSAINRIADYLAKIFIDPLMDGSDHARVRYRCAHCTPDDETSCAECTKEDW